MGDRLCTGRGVAWGLGLGPLSGAAGASGPRTFPPVERGPQSLPEQQCRWRRLLTEVSTTRGSPKGRCRSVFVCKDVEPCRDSGVCLRNSFADGSMSWKDPRQVHWVTCIQVGGGLRFTQKHGQELPSHHQPPPFTKRYFLGELLFILWYPAQMLS